MLTPTKRTTLRLLAGVAFLACFAAAISFLPIRDYQTRFLAWVRGLGNWGLVIFAASYTPASLLLIPGSLLTLGGGYLFGVVRGTLAVSVGSVAGASAAFWAGRLLFRGWIEGKLAGNLRFRALDQAVAEQGFKIVLLTRLSPVLPFGLLNYAFSMTKVRFRDYLLASWIGMLPATMMYVYLGSAVQSLADLAAGKLEFGLGQKVLFVVGSITTVVVTVVVTRVARTALRQAAPSIQANDQPAEPGAPHHA